MSDPCQRRLLPFRRLLLLLLACRRCRLCAAAIPAALCSTSDCCCRCRLYLLYCLLLALLLRYGRLPPRLCFHPGQRTRRQNRHRVGAAAGFDAPQHLEDELAQALGVPVQSKVDLVAQVCELGQPGACGRGRGAVEVGCLRGA